MKFSKQDLREIKEFALIYFNEKSSRRDPDYFLTECYSDAIITFLIKNGYKITKKDNNEST